MAQIKKIVKPGDLIRGAKTGLAALDKDGLVKSFPIPPNSTGKYLGIDVSNNPGWFNVPSVPAWDPLSDQGKVLVIGSNGPEWVEMETPIEDVTGELVTLNDAFNQDLIQNLNEYELDFVAYKLRNGVIKVYFMLHVIDGEIEILTNTSKNFLTINSTDSYMIGLGTTLDNPCMLQGDPTFLNSFGVYETIKNPTNTTITIFNDNEFSIYFSSTGYYFADLTLYKGT
jgi:hypothetical protein